MVDLFTDGAARFARAREHLDRLQIDMATLLNKNPYGIDTHVDHNGDGVIVFKTTFDPTEELRDISITLGEWLHNLRTGLNYFAYAMTINDTGIDPPPGAGSIEFPIFENSTDFAKKHRIKDVSGTHFDLIESKQPYQGGDFHDSTLWMLHELARLDRHRKLNVFGAYPVAMHFDITTAQGTAIVTHFPVPDTMKPLEDGDVVHRFHIEPWTPAAEIDVEPSGALQISSGDSVVPRGASKGFRVWLEEINSDAVALAQELRAAP